MPKSPEFNETRLLEAIATAKAQKKFKFREDCA